MNLTTLRIAQSGMQAAETRVEAVALNIANMQSTGTVPDAGGRSTAYQPLDVQQSAQSGGGVTASMVPRNPAYTLQFDPNSPDADTSGMVAAPTVDLGTELANLLMARLAYQANAKVMSTVEELPF
jgi:flagellar basal-body rod protein FlgC